MKRRDFICGAGLSALGLLLGCSDRSQSDRTATVNQPPSFAVIETRPHVTPSRIHWLDSSLEKLGSTEINHAAAGDYSRLAVMGEKLFLAPTGPTGRNDDRVLLSVELGSSRVTEYALEAINNYCVAASNGNAFVGGNLNFSSHISKVELADGAASSLTLSGLILDSIIANDSNLFAFAWEDIDGKVSSSLLTFDLDLNEISRIPLNDCGYCTFRPRILGDKLFIPSWTSIATQNSRSNTLGIYDIASGELEVIELEKPVLEAIPTDDGLVVVHSDIHQASSARTEIVLLDHGSWTAKSEGTLPYHAVQVEILNNELCALDSQDAFHLVTIDGKWEERLSSAVDLTLDDSHISSFCAV